MARRITVGDFFIKYGGGRTSQLRNGLVLTLISRATKMLSQLRAIKFWVTQMRTFSGVHGIFFNCIPIMPKIK